MIKSILQIVTDVSSTGLIGFHWTDTATGIHVDGKMSGGESNARAIILRIYGEWTPQVYVHNTELKTRAFEKWVKGYTYYDIDGAAEAIKAALALTPQARGVIKKAWGLVQTAMAKARPSGAYSDAVKDPNTAASIIKRERETVARIAGACQGLLDAYAPDADRTAARQGETALHSAVIEARAALKAGKAILK